MFTRRRILLSLAIAGLFLVITLPVRSRMASASPSPYAQVDVPNLGLAHPLRGAHLSRGEALALVQQKLNPSLFSHPYTVEYGAFDLGNVALRLNGPSSSPQILGTRDVWKITITGLRIVRPCAARVGALCPPPVSTLAVFVDDELGQVLESQGY